MAASTALVHLLCLVAAASAAQMRMCVPIDQMKDCQEMVEAGKTVDVDMTCVDGSDRLDCMEKVKGQEWVIQFPPRADFVLLDPEDMYIAAEKANNTFRVFKQIKTKEEPDAPFRYEAVAVIPKDLDISKLSDLKGLRSCHTGFGRNAGYKIPYTVLLNNNVLVPPADKDLSAAEFELKTLSTFFSKSCIVGKWSSHPEINRQLKLKYANLCSLCENPEKCDYPDVRSGYDGALRCLIEGDGQVAFTKVIVVKKFFGLPHGKTAAEASNYDPSKYVYLCPDGTKKPLDGPACPWAARPWQGFVTTKNVAGGENFEKLKEDIDKLSALGETSNANWRKTVLGMDDLTHPVNIEPVTPLKYLKKARYDTVITRDVAGPMSSIKICEVQKGFSPGKCPDLKKAAFVRGIRPKIECMTENSEEKCAESVASGTADIIIYEPHDAYYAVQKHKLKPILVEKYNNGSEFQYFVVVVPKGSSVQKFADLKNKRLCFWSSQKTEYDLTTKYLVEEGLLDAKSCPYRTTNFALGTYGSQTCMTNPSLTVMGKPVFDDAMMRPLVPGLGRDYVRYHPEEKFELLCKGGQSRRPFSEIEECNYGVIPPRMVLGKANMPDLQRDEIIATIVKIGELFNDHPEYFRLFGDQHTEPDVLASNTGTGFTPVKDVVPLFEEYKEFMKDLNNCNLKKKA